MSFEIIFLFRLRIRVLVEFHFKVSALFSLQYYVEIYWIMIGIGKMPAIEYSMPMVDLGYPMTGVSQGYPIGTVASLGCVYGYSLTGVDTTTCFRPTYNGTLLNVARWTELYLFDDNQCNLGN